MKKHTKQVIRCLKRIRKHLDQDTLTNIAYSAISDPKTGHIQRMIEACKANQGHTNLGLLDNNPQVIEELCDFYSIYPVIDMEDTEVIRTIESYWETEFYATLRIITKQKKDAPAETIVDGRCVPLEYIKRVNDFLLTQTLKYPIKFSALSEKDRGKTKFDETHHLTLTKVVPVGKNVVYVYEDSGRFEDIAVLTSVVDDILQPTEFCQVFYDIPLAKLHGGDIHFYNRRAEDYTFPIMVNPSILEDC